MDAQGLRRSERPVPEGLHRQPAELPEAAAAVPEGLRRYAAQLPKLPPRCPKGYVGTPPNCRKLPHKPCPKGYIGQPPNCKKMSFNKPTDRLKDVKKQFRKLKGLNKN